MNQLVEFEQLQSWTKITQRSKLESWLIENKIRYWTNKQGEPITTIDAIQGMATNEEVEKLEFKPR